MKKCIIISGGEITDYGKINPDIQGSLVICADAGYNHAVHLGVVPDILIGDFDTLDKIPQDVCKIITLCPDKDDTDTMAAVRIGIDRGCDRFEFYGALGGRLDHTFANIQILAYLKDKKIPANIISEKEVIMMIENESIEIAKKDGFSLSVFSYSEKCCGVTEKGVKYPLNDAALAGNFSLGVCNEIIDDFATISVKQGKMLIIQSKI